MINKLKGTIAGMIVNGFITGGLLFLISSMIIFIIRERENKAKH